MFTCFFISRCAQANTIYCGYHAQCVIWKINFQRGSLNAFKETVRKTKDFPIFKNLLYTLWTTNVGTWTAVIHTEPVIPRLRASSLPPVHRVGFLVDPISQSVRYRSRPVSNSNAGHQRNHPSLYTSQAGLLIIMSYCPPHKSAVVSFLSRSVNEITIFLYCRFTFADGAYSEIACFVDHLNMVRVVSSKLRKFLFT